MYENLILIVFDGIGYKLRFETLGNLSSGAATQTRRNFLGDVNKED